MKIDIFTLCDHAVNYGPKLCITGATDVIFAGQFPAVIQQAAIMAKMRFERHEQGMHTIKTSIIDADGKEVTNQPVVQVNVAFPPESPTGSELNMTFHIDNLRNVTIPKPGEYALSLFVDGSHVSTIPLFVVYVPKQQAPAK